MSGLIWIQTVCLSDGNLDFFLIFKFEKKKSVVDNSFFFFEKLPSMQKVNAALV